MSFLYHIAKHFYSFFLLRFVRYIYHWIKKEIFFNQSNLIFFLQHPSVEQRRLIRKEKSFFKKSNNAINNIPSESKKGTPSVAQRLNGVVFHKKINGFSVARHARIFAEEIEEGALPAKKERARLLYALIEFLWNRKRFNGYYYRIRGTWPVTTVIPPVDKRLCRP